MSEPRCPFCNAQGVKNIASKHLGPALLLYCGPCGAIHGVVPTPKQAPPVTVASEAPASTTPSARPRPKKFTDPVLPPEPYPHVFGELKKKDLSSSELGAMYAASSGGMLGTVFGDDDNEE